MIGLSGTTGTSCLNRLFDNGLDTSGQRIGQKSMLQNRKRIKNQFFPRKAFIREVY